MQMYFTAVVLPQELNEKVLRWKKWAQEGWGCKVGLKSPAHITLLPPFWMDEKMEEDLKKDMTQLYASMAPFDISTQNFDAFKPRTLFIAVAPNGALAELKKSTDDYFKQRPHYSAKIDTRPFHPHITIATRDLRKSAFAVAWPVLQQNTFTESFRADGVSLLRHNGNAWDVVHTALFKEVQ